MSPKQSLKHASSAPEKQMHFIVAVLEKATFIVAVSEARLSSPRESNAFQPSSP